MRRTFVQLEPFARAVEEEGLYAVAEIIEAHILNFPECGEVISGTGGVRKLRVGDETRRTGKRGGFRVLYLDIPTSSKTYLLVIYSKTEQANISFQSKTVIRRLSAELKKTAWENYEKIQKKER